MSREFDARNLVALPRLSALSMAALLQELLTLAAAEKGLPKSIAADRDDLAAAHADLGHKLKVRLAPAKEEAPGILEADIVEDSAFGALFDWLRGWARLPGDVPEAAEARGILAAIYPDGLKFTQIRPKLEWQEAETRLGIISERGYDATIEELGGKRFLEVLEAAHHVYGEVLGMTAVRSTQDVESPAVAEARAVAAEALRTYVLGVSAHARRGDPKSVARAARLLAPLSAWEDSAPQRGPTTTTATPSEPTASATP